MMADKYVVAVDESKFAEDAFECELSHIFTVRNEVWGKLMFLHLSVSHSVHRGNLPHCMLGYTSLGRYALPWQSPPARHPLPTSDITGCGQQAGGTHPAEMHTCYQDRFTQ